MTHKTQEYLKAVELEIECVKILSALSKTDFIRNPSKMQKVRANFLDLVSIKINKLNGILSAEIANLWVL